jgi:hypothetical protein
MKKKTSLWTLAGLGAAALAFLKFSEDLPITPLIPPAEVCVYPNLNRIQIDGRLLNLEIDYSNGVITQAYFYAEEKKLLHCRSLL